MPSELPRRTNAILAALSREAHITEHFAHAARCSVAEATVELMRLERQGLAQRDKCYAGMTWKAAERVAA